MALSSRSPPHREAAGRRPRPGSRAFQRPPAVLRRTPAARHPGERPLRLPAAARTGNPLVSSGFRTVSGMPPGPRSASAASGFGPAHAPSARSFAASGAVPALDRCPADSGRDRGSLHVHGGVPVPAASLLSRAASRRAAALRRPHRPAAGRGRRRLLRAARRPAREGAQGSRHPVRNARVPPGMETVPDRRSGGKRPGTARHRQPVPGMCRTASAASRMSGSRGRPVFP